MTNTVLILGASGLLGSQAAKAFADAGWQVRAYDRKTNDMTGAARGVDVIINGLNPPAYHNWAQLIPEITAQVIAAARASGALVIVPGNVYNFAPPGGIWDQDTPHNASTRKGRVRIEMEQAYRDAGVPTVILRAGNFIDPMRDTDVMGLIYMRDIAKGKITAPGKPDIMQAFCYLPDWARAAVALAEIRDALQSFEDIPFPGHSFSVHDLRAETERALGRDIRLTPFPWWIMKVASPFWELARELSEMRYLWNTPHQLDGAKFARLLPKFRATDLQTVMRAGLGSGPVDPAPSARDIHPDQPVA